jgi:tetratricopeptide (TPR) repeat protein
MRKNSTLSAPAVLIVATLLAVPAVLRASGSGSMPAPRVERQQQTPEQEAVELYNDGISYRDKAAKLEKEAEAEPDAKKREKLDAKAKDKHQDSIKKFDKATFKNPNMFQAWGSLGYAYRKTGDYAAALKAYGRALEIQPGYTPAIEYRAEAYLGLNQLDDVQVAYIALFNRDRPRADELAAAIDKWLAKKKADPSGVDPGKLDEFTKWAEQRKQLASQTSSVVKPAHERW